MRILSGIQPSGTIHIGNYFGMIKEMIALQDTGDLFAFIASYHALTSVKDKSILEKNTIDAAINFLALGMDPNKSTLYIQHHVKEVLELYFILSNYTPMSLLERGHAYKDKTQKGILSNHGLFSYPVLMAADILLFDANIVPVGKDQLQHIEMARDIARSFNNNYGSILTLPEFKINNEVSAVPGTDGNKMSKSYKNTIDLFATPKTLKKQVNSIVTDSKTIDEVKSFDNCTIYALSKLFMSPHELSTLEQRYLTPGEGYGHFKVALIDSINNYFLEYQEKRNYYENNLNEVHNILKIGADKASKIASLKMLKIRDAVGLI